MTLPIHVKQTQKTEESFFQKSIELRNVRFSGVLVIKEANHLFTFVTKSKSHKSPSSSTPTLLFSHKKRKEKNFTFQRPNDSTFFSAETSMSFALIRSLFAQDKHLRHRR
jgi:hypothetical protein